MSKKAKWLVFDCRSRNSSVTEMSVFPDEREVKRKFTCDGCRIVIDVDEGNVFIDREDETPVYEIKRVKNSDVREIRQVLVVDDAELLSLVLGKSLVDYEPWEWKKEDIKESFERLARGVSRFNLHEQSIFAEDFMLMHSNNNGFYNVVAFKHRFTRNYIYVLEGIGALILPVITELPFKRGEFIHSGI